MHYKGEENLKSERKGYNISVFDGCHLDTPVIDYRTAFSFSSIIHEVIDKCSGTIEEQPQPFDITSLKGANPMFTPVPLETLLQYASKAGATITTVGALRDIS